MCLEVDDLDVFLETCRRPEIGVNQVPKGDRLLNRVAAPDRLTDVVVGELKDFKRKSKPKSISFDLKAGMVSLRGLSF